MPSTKRYWQDLAQLDQAADVIKGREHEFQAPTPLEEVLGDRSFQGASTDRRDFLKFLGFGLGAATLAACETPVVKSIPYVNKPEEIVPGVANWYASTYYDGNDFASILVKTREARPIHIKGNPRHGLNRDPQLDKGSINSRINSSVLSLYDSMRLQGPKKRDGENWTNAGWSEADDAISGQLATIAGQGGRIVLLTPTVISPSIVAAFTAFKAKYATAEHVQYDPISYHGVTTANMRSFGRRAMPGYDLTQADVVVGVDCDFLSSWGNTTEHTWQYARRRRPSDAGMSKHIQFEARMSLTGANADERTAIKPSEVTNIVISLHDHVAKATGGAAVGGTDASCDAATAHAAENLLKARGRSVVLCGSNNADVQVLVNSINMMLGNYGTTIDLDNASNLFQGDDAAVAQLVKDLEAGRVGALLIAGVNPAYTLPETEAFKAGLAKTGLTVSFSGYADETASLCGWILPDHHYLESWNDFNPKPGHYAVAQPTINPLYSTRAWGESLTRWCGQYINWHDHVKGVWRARLEAQGGNADERWYQAVHDGVLVGFVNAPGAVTFAGDVNAAAAAAKASVQGAGEWELQVYTSEAIGDGSHANNPWLQEMPDPITKLTWDNALLMAPADVERLGLNRYIGQEHPASVCKVAVNGVEVELPVLAAPGQKAGTLAVALGYGRGANGEAVGRAACLRDDDGKPMPVGRNAYPFTVRSGGAVSYDVLSVSVTPTGATYPLALTQTHLTDMERHSVVKETTFATWAKHDSQHTYNPPHLLAVHEDVNGDGLINALDKKPVTQIDLWEEHPVEGVGHRWGLSIDLNSCIGCGACVTACNSENNIPVVGKDEVRRSREMHWLRIDRYFNSDMTKARAAEESVGTIAMYTAMERPAENPRVVFMPVMCQHCNHAPCETVCPVAATTHSNEGLNQMSYNRCIGTRYCANNCPYKVRRFNWFNYVTEKFGQVNPAWDEVGRMVLNPDVTVRARGVIEKCSLCVQSIQAGKFAAKKAGRPVKDGDIETACSAACGAGAIIFGDLNDTNSRVRNLSQDERSYHMLEELGVKPNVNYLAKVRNTEAEEAHHA
ncbi:MAG: TAT-variant-translocated molybdopterin oxidoreductase [Flavobacteriales bacterium]|nr:TAT-variant-translocated molybdopterin oxidoreductase [Flavobacteriales bacterium]